MRILLAVDSSEASQRAAGFVETHLADHEVHTVTAEGLAQVPPVYAPGAPATVSIDGRPILETHEVFPDGSESAEPLSFSHDVATALVEAAETLDVDLIVVGSSDRGLLERIFLGSVSQDVVQKAERPVLVVK